MTASMFFRLRPEYKLRSMKIQYGLFIVNNKVRSVELKMLVIYRSKNRESAPEYGDRDPLA